MTRIQKIVNKLFSRLGEIQVVNGYRTDAGLRSILIDTEADPEREFDGQAHDVGLVMQMEPAEPTDQTGNVKLGTESFAHFTQDIGIFGFRKLPDRSDWFARGQELEADIKQSVFSAPEDQQFYRQLGLKSISIATAQARVPGYGDEFLGVEVALQLIYVENLSAPWEP